MWDKRTSEKEGDARHDFTKLPYQRLTRLHTTPQPVQKGAIMFVNPLYPPTSTRPLPLATYFWSLSRISLTSPYFEDCVFSP